MKNVISRKKSFAPLIIIGLCVLLLGSYFVLHMSIVSSHTGANADIIKVMSDANNHIKSNPMGFKWDESIKKNFLEYEKWYLIFVGMIWLILYASKGVGRGEFEGIEHGSAEWATKNDLLYYRKKSNTIIGDRLYLKDEEPLKRKKKRIKNYNYNSFLIGGPGSGKSFTFIKPNVLLAQDNYVITDVKGEIYQDTAHRLREQGYTIKVFNLIEPKYSMAYNPLAYIKEDNDILIIAEIFLRNTENGKASGGDAFWFQAEKSLLQALIFYVHHELPKEERNFSNVLKLLLSAIQVEQNEENAQTARKLTVLDMLFADLESKNPNHVALESWKIFKLSAGETEANIMVGLAVRFSIFTTEEIKRITKSDDMELDRLAEEKIAIYLMIPDSNRTLDLLSALFFTQLFYYMMRKADFEYPNKRLPRHVKILADEFYNCGTWPNFPGIASVIRSRNMAVHVVIQELSQIKSRYKDEWEAIIGCCDTLIFMGSPSQDTREYISRQLGPTTAKIKQESYSRGGRTDNVNLIARPLMSADELRTKLPDEKQIILTKGTPAIFIDKFKTKRSKLYKYFDHKEDYKKIIQMKKPDKEFKEEIKESKEIDMQFIFDELEKVLADIG